MRAPMMSIHTVAAGGGSILHFDGARFRVGPDSAGADPGPKCYRRGGPLAVTDANVMLGKLIPDFFPKIFGPRQDQPLDADSRARGLRGAGARRSATGAAPEEVADGFIAIAVAKMAEAIKKISVARGYDVTRYALNCFGGAGGQHACVVADALAIETVLIHPLSSLLSAYGMGLADIGAHRSQGVEERSERGDAARASPRLRRKTRRRRRSRRSPRRASRRAKSSRARARNCATPAPTRRSRSTSRDDPRDAARVRDRRTRRASASLIRDKALVDRGGQRRGDRRRRALRRARGRADRRRGRAARPSARRASSPTAPGARRSVYLREHLPLGARVAGPALIIEPHQTIVVEDGWRAEITRQEPCRAAAREGRRRGARRSAPRPIRSCSRSSTISSCRSPSRWA